MPVSVLLHLCIVDNLNIYCDIKAVQKKCCRKLLVWFNALSDRLLNEFILEIELVVVTNALDWNWIGDLYRTELMIVEHFWKRKTNFNFLLNSLKFWQFTKLRACLYRVDWSGIKIRHKCRQSWTNWSRFIALISVKPNYLLNLLLVSG